MEFSISLDQNGRPLETLTILQSYKYSENQRIVITILNLCYCEICHGYKEKNKIKTNMKRDNL